MICYYEDESQKQLEQQLYRKDLRIEELEAQV